MGPFYAPINPPKRVRFTRLSPEFEPQEAWYIYAALGIHNLGDIAAALALEGDPAQLRGCVIEMRPDPLDTSVKPRIHLIPDGFWSHTYFYNAKFVFPDLRKSAKLPCFRGDNRWFR